MERLAPIILFVYNRPDLTEQTIEYLKKNTLADESDLFIFSDAAKDHNQNENVKKVREKIRNVNGFNKVQIYEASKNKGLANSIIDGVTQVINVYGNAIVIEDDLKTSPYFLQYMNEALTYYNSHNDIWSISGYAPTLKFPTDYISDVYKTPRGCSWGWGTWENRWRIIDWNILDYDEFKKDMLQKKKFNQVGNELTPMLDAQMNNEIDSWAIRWYYNQFKNRKYTIYPKFSFIENKGFRGESTHGSLTKRFDTQVIEQYNIKFENPHLNPIIIKEFTKYFNLTFINYVGKFFKKIGFYRIAKQVYKKFVK